MKRARRLLRAGPWEFAAFFMNASQKAAQRRVCLQ